LHTCGAVPRFKPLGWRQGYYTPKNYFGTEYQNIFENKLLNRHPREGAETFQWRLSQYKPITRAPFLQIIELVFASIFQDNNYHIEVSDEKEEKYILGTNFDNTSIVDWINKIGSQSIIEDPNGFIVRIPTHKFDEEKKSKLDVSIWFVKTIDVIYKD